MRRRTSFIAILLALMSTATFCISRTARAQGDQQVYTDTLQAGWQNWSWCASDFNSKDYIHTGAASVKITYTAAWQGFYLHSTPINTANYTNLTFWIDGGATNGRNLVIAGILNNASQGNVALNQFISGGGVAANTWRQVTVPLSAIGLGKTTAMTGFWIMESGGSAQAPFYIDDVTLVGTNTPPPPQTLTIDFNASRHPINPQIYGLAFASQTQLSDLNAPLNRWGGNATTRYNWQLNASNHASDWFFESIGSASSTPSADADSFIQSAQSANAQAMMTIPTIGWVAKLGVNRAKTWSFSQAKYGAQTAAEGDAGNGVLKNGQYVTGNDPNDANTPGGTLFQQAWVQHLVSTFGPAAKGGLTYYIMDNEPSIWYTTHRDVQPVGPKMDEIANKIADYASKIKAVDPNAQIVGPEEWGWTGYFYSGYDMQYCAAHGWSNPPDRAAHGGMDAMPWILQDLYQYDVKNKVKSLDVFSLHYYPQGGEYGNDTSTAMQLRRNRSTRSLWDPNYVDETWINSKVQLIPRMKNWVSTYYPGLKTAITEYNWGAENHINGATTQADIYGIFGREGLDMGARWTVPSASTPTYKAMKMYRNVDGNNNGFGDTSVSDVASDPDNVSSFAAVRSSDNAETFMVINKSTASQTINMTLKNAYSSGILQSWQLTSTNAITRLADSQLPAASAGTITGVLTVPAQSVTLYVATPAPSVPAAPANLTATAGNAQVTLNWNAIGGATYNIKRSTTKGGPYTKIGTAVTNSYVDTTVTNGTTYYYVVSAVNTVGEGANSNEASATPGGPTGKSIRLNSAGGAVAPFAADGYYARSCHIITTTSNIDLSGVSNPAPLACYQSARADFYTMKYTVPGLTAGAACTVRLHFAELHYNGPGGRAMNIAINGTTVLTNFDIFAAAGAKNRAIVKEFPAVADASGKVTVELAKVKDCATLNALEVIAP